MKIIKLKTEEDFNKYSEALKDFEKEFDYPIEDKRFTISHGNAENSYFSFFKRLGMVNYYIVEDNNKIVGGGACILKTVKDNDREHKYWYITDFKFSKGYRKKGLLKKIILKSFIYNYFRSRKFVSMIMKNKEENKLSKKLQGLFSWFNVKSNKYYCYEWDFYTFVSDISTNKFVKDNYLLYTNDGIKDILIDGRKRSQYHLIEKQYGLENYPNHVFPINNETLSKLDHDTNFMLGTAKKSQVEKLRKAKVRFDYDVTFVSNKVPADKCSLFSGEI